MIKKLAKHLYKEHIRAFYNDESLFFKDTDIDFLIRFKENSFLIRAFMDIDIGDIHIENAIKILNARNDFYQRRLGTNEIVILDESPQERYKWFLGMEIKSNENTFEEVINEILYSKNTIKSIYDDLKTWITTEEAYDFYDLSNYYEEILLESAEEIKKEAM